MNNMWFWPAACGPANECDALEGGAARGWRCVGGVLGAGATARAAEREVPVRARAPLIPLRAGLPAAPPRARAPRARRCCAARSRAMRI